MKKTIRKRIELSAESIRTLNVGLVDARGGFNSAGGVLGVCGTNCSCGTIAGNSCGLKEDL